MSAEEKLFVPHSEQEEQQQLEIIRGTMTDDCVYELKNTGERWQGWSGTLQLYKTFLGAFLGMRWVPQTVVIGPRRRKPGRRAGTAGVGALLSMEPRAESVRGRDDLLDPATKHLKAVCVVCVGANPAG